MEDEKKNQSQNSDRQKMPPRPHKRRKVKEEEGANDAVIPDELTVEALVAAKQEQNGNPQENRVEQRQAEESAMSMVLKEMRSMREEMKEMKGLQEKTSEELKGVREEVKGVREETNEKMESVFEELVSVNSKLSEARKEIAALKPRYKFRSNEELRAVARLWCSDRNKAIAQYGHISYWNVSSITSMRYLFGRTGEEYRQRDHWNKDFDEDLSSWDTSNTTLTFMFDQAESFKGDLKGWNVERKSRTCRGCSTKSSRSPAIFQVGPLGIVRTGRRCFLKPSRSKVI